jgi:uncharacterized membrane protein
LIIAVAQPVINTYSRKQSLVFLVDRSDSTGRDAAKKSLEFIKKVLDNKKEKDNFAVISFAERAILEKNLNQDKFFSGFESNPNGSYTNIETALKKGLMTLGNKQGRLVLLSDGKENLGQTKEVINKFKNSNIAIDVYSPYANSKEELFIENVVLPQRIRTGTSFEMKVYIYSREQQQGRLRIYHNDELGREKNINIKSGKNLIEYAITLSKPGFHSFRAEIEGNKDSYKMNNVHSSFVIVEGAPHILCLDGNGEMTANFLAGLKKNGLVVSKMESKYFSYDLTELQKYDAVIMENIAADSLNLRQIKNIISYVGDAGGGLLVIGGVNSFGAGSYTKSPLNSILPLSSEVKSEVYFPTTSISIVFDKSESMKEIQSPKGNLTKLDLAKEATSGVIDLLVKEEKLGIIAFDTNATVLAPLQPVNDKYILYEKFSRIKSGGGTDVYRGLEAAHKMLVEDKSSVKHVILISDGKTRSAEFESLLGQFNQEEITLTTVAVGEGSEKKLMKKLASQGKGKYYYTDTIQSLPAVFSAEAKRIINPSIINKKTGVMASENLENITSIIGEEMGKEMPVLDKFNATTQRKTADLLLYTENNFPVLASWRYGLGRTAAFTGDSGSSFATKWTTWNEYNKFWSDMLKWLMRPEESNLFYPYVVQRENKFIVKVDAVINGEYVNNLEINTVISGPAGYREIFKLRQTGPGLYQNQVEVGSRGAYLITMNWKDKEGNLKSKSAGYVLSYSPEYLPAEGSKLLGQLAQKTGGRQLDSPEEIFNYRPRYVTGQKNIWHIFVMIALIVFLIEIALRVVSFNLFRRFLYSLVNRFQRLISSLSEESKDI